jgi:hypothetical protein
MRDKAPNLKAAMIALVMAGTVVMTACSSDPPSLPELSPKTIFSQIGEKWSHDEMNHFTLTFHSDTLVECGVKNDLWKLTEMTDRAGTAWSAAYQLTDKGKAMVSAIDLKESGRGHSVTVKGPYHVQLTNISDGSQPNTKRVTFRWDIDWDKAPAEMNACLPKFEMSGYQIALFELTDGKWRLVSYLRPEEVPAGQPGSIMGNLR